MIPVELLGDAQPLPRHLVNVHQCGACATVYGEVPTTATPKPSPFRLRPCCPKCGSDLVMLAQARGAK